MSGLIGKLYEQIALLSPQIEVKLRQFYWKHASRLKQYAPNYQPQPMAYSEEKVNLDEIINQLRIWGVREGSLLIVHSSYDSLRCTGLKPDEIIDKLLGLVGSTGTLAMPVIRQFKENPPIGNLLESDLCAITCKYNVKRTPVITGLIPSMMMRRSDAIISRFPLNPLCAIGPLAKKMMEHNLDGILPSAHGKNSSWKFCLDHNAFVCSIGTDLRHHNTMGHVAEEAFDGWYWSDEEWYNIRTFIIEERGKDSLTLQVKERKPEWGMLHQAELNRYHDLLKEGIIKTKLFDSVLVEFEESQKLITYLQSKNKNGYPYFK